MNEDNILTLVFASLGIIMVVTSVSFLLPKGGLTGLAVTVPIINPLYFLAIPGLLAMLVIFFKFPRQGKDPIKNYVKSSRKKGLSELQIKNNLTEVGWNEEDFSKFLK
jgi:hypothetical protein